MRLSKKTSETSTLPPCSFSVTRLSESSILVVVVLQPTGERYSSVVQLPLHLDLSQYRHTTQLAFYEPSSGHQSSYLTYVGPEENCPPPFSNSPHIISSSAPTTYFYAVTWNGPIAKPSHSQSILKVVLQESNALGLPAPQLMHLWSPSVKAAGQRRKKPTSGG